MNIDIIKHKIIDLINKEKSFIYKGNRNQIEKFNGFIDKCYSRIFLIRSFDGKIKCFSYSDIIIGNIEILS